MTILSKYILREFLLTLLYGLAVVLALFMIIELFQRLDVFIKYQAPFSSIIRYLSYMTPGIIILLCPIAVLLSSFITFGVLSRNFEIIALRASGVSLYRIIIPVLMCTFLISIASLLGNELVAPHTNRVAEETYDKIKGRVYGKSIYSGDQIWYRGEEVIYNIKVFHRQFNVLEGVALYYFDNAFELIKRVDAERARWQNNQWVFENVTTRTFNAHKENKTIFEKNCTIPLTETPETFKQEVREPEEMSFRELEEYIEKTTQEGYDTTPYLADLYAKISSPFINFVIALLGIPFAVRIGKHGGFALGVTMSFFVGFGYWVFFNLCLALGHSGALSPLLSAWVANITFVIVGLWLLLQIRF